MLHFYDHLRAVDYYQRGLANSLKLMFGGVCEVRTEWDAMLRSEKAFCPPRQRYRRRMYSPAVDIAVGPFATDRRYIDDYDQLLSAFRPVVERLLNQHHENLLRFDSDFLGPDFQTVRYGNQNARCFVAIEIEKGNPAAKYLIGSALNAAALGRIGIVVCWNEDRLQSLFRIREYLCQLTALEKNAFSAQNLLVLTREQLPESLSAWPIDPFTS